MHENLIPFADLLNAKFWTFHEDGFFHLHGDNCNGYIQLFASKTTEDLGSFALLISEEDDALQCALALRLFAPITLAKASAMVLPKIRRAFIEMTGRSQPLRLDLVQAPLTEAFHQATVVYLEVVARRPERRWSDTWQHSAPHR